MEVPGTFSATSGRMNRVCAWCGAVLFSVRNSLSESHALCDGCLEDLREALPPDDLRVRPAG